MNRRDRQERKGFENSKGKRNLKVFFAVICLLASLALFGQAGALSGSFLNILLETYTT